MAKDYYKILGVEKNASQDEIKQAFRRLAHQYHPDKTHGNEEKFKEVNEAYQVLGNSEKRKQYDQFGATFDQQGGFGQGMNWEDFMRYARGSNGNHTGGVDFGDLGDIFGDLFGFGKRRHTRSRRGDDIQIQVDLTFQEAAFGVEKEFEIYRRMQCKHCGGNGAEPGSKITECSACGGQGQVQATQQTIFGSFRSVQTCPKCHGEGRRPEKECKECKGAGIIRGAKRIRVNIPQGIDNGETVRIPGEGEAAANGASGDLFVSVRVRPDSHFKREGADIHTEEECTFSQAALGSTLRVKTIDGEVDLKIPESTQTGTVFRLRNKGLPYIGSSRRGDHFVEIIVQTPKHLSRKQKDLFKQLSDEGI